MRALYLAPRILFFLLAGYVILEAWNDLAAGGNSWKQGDWLINSLEAPIRRGLLGNVLIESAAALGISPVLLVVVVQTALVAGSAILIALALWRMTPRYSLWLLVIAPGFFLRFWALDTQGGLRKETIAFFAFALLLFAVVRVPSGRVLPWLASAVFSVAVIGHEGMVFLAPFFLAGLYIMHRAGALGRGDTLLMSGLVAATCLAAVAMALILRNADYLAVCRPLLEQGVDEAMCDGAIKALEIPLSKYVKTTFWMALSWRMVSFLTLVVLNSAFMLVLGGYLMDFRSFARPYLASTLLFVPLFIVAVDWGRWVSFHTTASVFVLLMALWYGIPRAGKGSEVPPLVFAGLLLFTLFWGFSHFLDVLWGGLAWWKWQGGVTL